MKKLACKILGPIDKVCAAMPEWVLNLSMRIIIFKVFWFSAQTKISGLTLFGQHFAFWNVTETTIFLFDFEYGVPLIPADIAAYLGTFGEFFLSLMILFGFLTRFAALGLVVMTLVIQYVYPDFWWSSHAYWLVILIYLVRHGGGQVSVDRFLCGKKSP